MDIEKYARFSCRMMSAEKVNVDLQSEIFQLDFCMVLFFNVEVGPESQSRREVFVCLNVVQCWAVTICNISHPTYTNPPLDGAVRV